MCYRWQVERGLRPAFSDAHRPHDPFTADLCLIDFAIGQHRPMTLVRNEATTTTRSSAQLSMSMPAWRVLIVDDEEDIHGLTQLSLAQFHFDGRGVEFLHAYSAAEAKEILTHEGDIALALIDVVMETETAGLELVDYIRTVLKLCKMRLIVRTGQPGVAPEQYVIDNFDIDDYKDKTELTTGKLYTSTRSAIKAYRDLSVIEATRTGLEHILDVTPHLYFHSSESMTTFYEGLLTQIAALCHIRTGSLITGLSGMVIEVQADGVEIKAGSGELSSNQHHSRTTQIVSLCDDYLRHPSTPPPIDAGAQLLPLASNGVVYGCVYLENTQNISEDDLHLIRVLTNQYAAALSNIHLHQDLLTANREALHMLAVASEYKDEDTGTHIHRMMGNTRTMALRMGMDKESAQDYADAATLHDVGKLGIPDEILIYPGPLTDAQFAIMKTHATIGEKIMGDDPNFELARMVAVGHHERWDGTGYPFGVGGENIPLIARIVAILDVFDALTHRRPYKAAWPVEDALSEIQSKAGSQFDPQLVELFMQAYREGAITIG